jgi:ABC-type polysaccharide/polyol phosphate export permease
LARRAAPDRPCGVGLLFCFTLGAALLVAALAVVFRDVLQLLGTVLMVEFFACPIVYLASTVGERFRVFVALNPLTPYFNLIRAGLLPQHPVAWEDLGLAVLWATAALASGLLVFRRLRASFADHG